MTSGTSSSGSSSSRKRAGLNVGTKAAAGTVLVALAKHVTGENYPEQAKTFIQARVLSCRTSADEVGFLIALEDGSVQGKHYRATLPQWGAWLAYFHRIGYSSPLMVQCGKTGKCFLVPAEFPHMFDEGASVEDDKAAGAEFSVRHLERKAQEVHRAQLPKPHLKGFGHRVGPGEAHGPTVRDLGEWNDA